MLDVFDSWVDELHPRLLPKSPLRRATTYAINQREFFRRCFSDGRFEIDNGRVERRIRPYAVARRNFLFTGSPRGGERLAAIFTLVDSCLLLGLDPYDYLVDVIRKLEAGLRLKGLTDLIPSRWAAQRRRSKPPTSALNKLSGSARSALRFDIAAQCAARAVLRHHALHKRLTRQQRSLTASGNVMTR